MAPSTSAEAVKRECEIAAMGAFDNWDPRECAVANAEHWRVAVADYLAAAPPAVPKVIHQIWIGDREPPCVWLDTWRVDFLNSPAGRGWQYKLWDNEAVAGMEMINRDLFDREEMMQCRADLLRLEICYQFGGMYCDADLVWLGGRGLEEVWESCRESRFLCGYEPDTKDKPYSVLGNSVFLCSKGHPLLRLLMSYIAQIYDAKRPYNTVEWVTGPLAFTKALVHTGMPFTVPEQKLFYPSFHYVPNPSAVNMKDFPDSIAFQFGYSCSGLSEWVKNNNRCRRALECPHHQKKTDYPLGAIHPFPVDGPPAPRSAAMPRIIHQFCLSDAAPPSRWLSSWEEFCAAHDGFEHRLWTHESLAQLGGFFCANMYPAKGGRPTDSDTILLLALEVLYQQGGYYVPLSTLYAPESNSGKAEGLPVPSGGEVLAVGSILASQPLSEGALAAIKSCYDTGKPRLPSRGGAAAPNVRDQGYGDEVVCYASFAKESQFLGAAEIVFSTETGSPRGVSGAEQSALAFAYQCQTPLTVVSYGSLSSVRESKGDARTLFVTDAQMALYPVLFEAVPGFIYDAEQQEPDWSCIVIAMEWETGTDERVVYRTQSAARIEGATYVAVVLREGKKERLPDLFSGSDQIADWCLSKHAGEVVMCATFRFAHTEDVSTVYQAMPIVASVFLRICGHTIPSWERDETEIHGSLLKGLVGGQLAFELAVDQEKRIMYRAFNPSGGLNCEIKINQGAGGRHVVDHARVFADHEVVFEGQQIAV
jgi:mannosyltransferase OCH1-like enzyme